MGVSQARILEWVAISRDSFPGTESTSPAASALEGGLFTTEPLGSPNLEVLLRYYFIGDTANNPLLCSQPLTLCLFSLLYMGHLF